jgi:hypothetical protein
MKATSGLYDIWHSMRQRCFNPNHPFYYRYGGRGINICSEWNSFDVFYSWAKPLHQLGLSLDRFNNDKGYTPDNCRFVTQKEQCRNTCRNTLTVEKVGKIKALLITGRPQKEIVALMDVDFRTVSALKRGICWADVSAADNKVA